MKILLLILFIFGLTTPLFAVSVGGPDMTIPEASLYLKELEVKKTLDRLEYNMNIKASLDAEIIAERELTSSPADVSSAELDGHNFMVKFSSNFYNVVEPYVKVGTSNLTVKWDQYGRNVKVETDPGFVWGAGVKAKLWGQKDYGVKLTLDLQYRDIDLDFDKAKIGGSSASTRNENFRIKEWQTSLLVSKRFMVPIGTKDYFIVPYTGLSFSSLDANVYFTNVASGSLYSTYNASDENVFGFVLGCDIMPFYLSYYLLNFEMRLINETAFTLGGTIKF